MNVKIASAQYNISFLEDWQAYDQKIERWVVEAITQEAKILVWHHYLGRKFIHH